MHTPFATLRLVLAAVLALLAAPAPAHPALGTIVAVTVRPDGRVEVIVIHDALAYALNDTSARVTDPQMYALLDGPPQALAAALQDGRERFELGFRVIADGNPLPLELVRSPTTGLVDRWKLDNPAMRLPLKMEFEAHTRLPPGAANLSVRAPQVFGEVILSVSRPGKEPVYLPLSPAQESPPLDVSMASPPAAGPAPDAPTAPHTRGDSVSSLSVFWRYLELGYRHIMPEGHDHELFILGLFLLNTKLKDLLLQTTAFTIAHTTTLTLATFGLVAAPSNIVEPLIALTIGFIAVENLFASGVSPWRLAAAFAFGLVHGLGFATGLMDIGLPTGQLLSGLIAFNIGVEGGHLTVLAIAFLTIGWFRKKDWYRAYISIPLSIAIALVALFWFVQRII